MNATHYISPFFIMVSYWTIIPIMLKITWGVLCWKQLPMAGTRHYMSHNVWHVFTCPSPWYLSLERKYKQKGKGRPIYIYIYIYICSTRYAHKWCTIYRIYRVVYGYTIHTKTHFICLLIMHIMGCILLPWMSLARYHICYTCHQLISKLRQTH